MKLSLFQAFSLFSSLSLMAVAGNVKPPEVQAHSLENQVMNTTSTPAIQSSPEPMAVESNFESVALNLTNLPDGEHFYGEVSDPKQMGADYFIFRKEGQTVSGILYTYQSGQIACYQGKVNSQAITKADVATVNEAGYGDPQASPWLFTHNETIDLSGLQKLNSTQIPATVENELQECLRMNYTANR